MKHLLYKLCIAGLFSIDNEIYNVNGGSISIGHPYGMTGADDNACAYGR